MRRPLLLLSLAILGLSAAPASAQIGAKLRSKIEFDTTRGTPLMDVEVGGRKLRFALDPLLGRHLVLNPGTVRMLAFRPIEGLSIEAGLDEATVTGAAGRMLIRAKGGAQYVYGVFLGQPHLPYGSNEQYDLAGGFESLPAKTVIVHLNRDLTGPMRNYRFSRSASDAEPGFPVRINDTRMRMNVQFANAATWLDRRAAEMLVDEGKMRPRGQIVPIPAWFGMQIPVQEVVPTTPVSLKGLIVERLQARTPDPLILPQAGQGEIIVSSIADDDRSPVILVGTQAFRDCASMTFNRLTRSLTLRCRVPG